MLERERVGERVRELRKGVREREEEYRERSEGVRGGYMRSEAGGT